MSSEDPDLPTTLFCTDEVNVLDPVVNTVADSLPNRSIAPAETPRAQAVLVLLVVLAALGMISNDRTPLSSAHSPATSIRIDLNRASHEELNLLPGIGDKMAVKLIDHRDLSSGFANWQTVESIPGMGPATVREMQRWCYLGHSTSASAPVVLASSNPRH